MPSLPDRRFFVHAPHLEIGVTSPAWQPLPEPTVVARLPQTDLKPRLCLVSGCPSYQSDQSLSSLAGFIEQHYDVACEKAFARSRTDLPGLERLMESDCLVLFAQRLAIAGPQLELLHDYIACGGSVVALIPPGSAFLRWPDWEAEVLGIRSTARAYGSPGAAIETAPYADGHPVLRDVGRLRHPGCVTTLPDVDEHTTSLLSACIGERLEPVACVRTHNDARSFFTTLGQPTDFQQPAFLQLLANAVLWAIGKPDSALSK
jgi:hypothetical protein